jgi:hypothetical protein
MTALPAETVKEAGPTSALPIPRSEASAVLHMIERAARDPAVDIDKLQQLMAMRERIEARQSEADFDKALTAAQAGMGRVRTDSNNPQTKSRYASYGALDAAMRPVYTANGFALSFNTENPAPEIVRVICRVSHQNGHSRTYQIDMPADGKGARGGDVMTKTHATGSAVSYGMRYLLKMIFNIAVSDRDDDGNAAGRKEPENYAPAPGSISEDQAANIREALEAKGASENAFIQWAAGKGFFAGRKQFIAEIPAERYDACMTAIAGFRKG